MELNFSQFLTVGLLIISSLLIFQFYWNFMKKYAGLPFCNIFTYLVKSHVTGKISKENPLSKVLLQKIIETAKQNMKEGMFLTFHSQLVLIVFGEAAFKIFHNVKAIVDKPLEYSLLIESLGNGLITSNGERWRSHRKIMNPAFQMRILKEKITLFNEHAMNLVKDMEKLVEEPYTDILNVLKCHYFNSLSESVLGLRQSKENKVEILKFCKSIDRMADISAKGAFFPWLRSNFFLKISSQGRKFCQDIKETDEFINKLITRMKKHFSSNESIDTEIFSDHLRKSFTYLLLNQHFKDPTFTFKDVHAEVKTVMAAGYDTVAYSTLWCLFLLGLHPEIQEKVYDEILSSTSDYVTYEESSNLSYLESVILESQRIFTTIPIFSRVLSEDVVHDKYRIPKGTTIVFVPHILHKDPKIYPDPEEFIPERFLNAETKRSTNFIPFAEGSRSCIGKNYALIQMKIFLAHILRNFKISSLDKKNVDVCWTIVLSPVKPLRMKITLRQKKLL